MMFSKRRWCVGPVDSAEALAEKLTGSTWCLCTGFFVRGHENYLFLNDATHEDGAAEFAIIRGGIGASEHEQIESITFSWCDRAKALEYVRDILAGRYDSSEFAHKVSPRLDPVDRHGRCHLCA